MPEPRPISLPIDEHIPRILQAVMAQRDVVLIAEPGAGKTTRVAPAIVRAGLLKPPNEKLILLQPRRVAARAAAARIAFEQGWSLGDQVGYQVRFERIFSGHTPLRVVTEGILVRRLIADPELDGIGCVILDEFHERSVHSDLSLAMLREAKALRPDLRLVVMSATLDVDAVAAFLAGAAESEAIHVPGRLFPVEVEYAGDSPAPIEECVAEVLRNELNSAPSPPDPGAIAQQPLEQATRPSKERDGVAVTRFTAVSGEEGAARDVLVFLPGVREIERTISAISRLCARHGYETIPLHGSLTRDEQDRAISFEASAPRRVICATNIAETSLTLPGVRLVIDSGLVRQAGYNPARGIQTLSTTRISKASAEQRRGRAGRVASGRCIRLWSRMAQHRLADFDVPEVLRIDLAEACLAVRAWGGDPATFGWFQAPEPRLLAAAQNLLEILGGVEAGRLTPLGRELARLPLHPREARLLLAAPAHLANQAATVAALLGEGAEVPGHRTANVRELLEAFARRQLEPAVTRAAERARDALLASIATSAPPSRSPPATLVLEELLLLAYPDRLCKRREGDPALAKLVEGGGVRLPDAAAVAGDLFLALDVRLTGTATKQQADVRLVANIDEAWLARDLPQNIVQEEVALYEESTGQVVNLRRRRYGDLVLQEQRTGAPAWQDAETLLREHLAGRALQLIQEDEVLGDIYRRWHFVCGLRPHETRTLVLPPESELVWQGCAGATSRREVIERGRSLVQSALRNPRSQLDVWAPQEITIPSGSRVRLDWSEAVVRRSGDMQIHPPVLAVRLQELFGLADTPRVGPPPGVPITLRILGPNFRPVQVTSDLASFWRNTYPQVRKDLRARYPKHSWPEDPLAAPPVRGACRRKPR